MRYPPSDQMRHPPPNQMRHPPPNQMRHPPPNQMRHPQPDQRRFPQPDQMRHPPPDQIRHSQPDQMRHPPPDQMRHPQPDQMRPPLDQRRFPNPEQMRHPPPFRAPAPEQLRNMAPDQMRYPPPTDQMRHPPPGQTRHPTEHNRGPRPSNFQQGPSDQFMRPPEHNRFPPPNNFNQQQGSNFQQQVVRPPSERFQHPPPNFQHPPPVFKPPLGDVRPPVSSSYMQQPNFSTPTSTNFSQPPQENLQPQQQFMNRPPPPVRPDFSKPPPNFFDPSKPLPLHIPLSQPSTNQPGDYNRNYSQNQSDYNPARRDNLPQHGDRRDSNYNSSMYDQQIKEPTLDSPTLGSADYTKIVRALETLKSGNIAHRDSSLLETEPITPPVEEKERDKEKKRKKEKKHKKEKKKKKEKKGDDEEDIKKRLEEKLAELATLNNEDGSGQHPTSLSIQFKQHQQPSKFNLKIESPVLKGNVFQKYKAAQLFRSDFSVFPTKNVDHGERKYRKTAESGKEMNEEDTVPGGQSVKNDDDDDDDIKTKEDLLKMLGIVKPVEKPPPTMEPEVLHSGSEDGEVLSEDEIEERKKIKEIIKQAKEEALKSNSPPASVLSKVTAHDTLTNDADSAVSDKIQPVTKDKPADHTDGEISSDGEVSSDGEISDDSLDEFGRSKKLRTNEIELSDHEDKYRQKGYSSGSDSSGNSSDEENKRWERPPSRFVMFT